jgi:Ca2+-binding RTX toxin-like protein
VAEFRGTDGNDVIIGSTGDDIFYSSKGQDTLDGGAGYDKAIIDFAVEGANGGGQSISYMFDGLYGRFSSADGLSMVTTVRIEEIDLRMGGANEQFNLDLNYIPQPWKVTIDAGAGHDFVSVNLQFSSDAFVGSVVGGTLSSGALTLKNFEQFHLGLGNGADKVTLGESNDTVRAGNGDDEISGAGGSDVLEGGWGGDTLSGGEGNDKLYADSEYLGTDSRTERDILSGGGGDDLVSVGYGDDADGGTGNDRLSLSLRSGTQGVTLDLSAMFAGGTIVLGGGTIRGFESYDTIYGTEFGDTIVTGDAPSNGTFLATGIAGYGGNDIITTGSRRDVVNGGQGDDTIRGGGDDDRLSGDEGRDFIYGEAGNDILSGGDGDDELFGGEGLDSLNGGAGIDRLYGENGDDTLDGDLGDDFLYGGAGRDTLTGGFGADRLEGGADDDIYHVDAFDTVVEVAGGGTDEIRTGAAQFSLAGHGQIENLTGTGFVDQVLTGNALNNRIDGGAGSDHMEGGAGNDVYIVSDQGDTVLEYANEGIDEIRSSVSIELGSHTENLTLTGFLEIDGFGNELANVITGNNAQNILFGAGGNDHLIGGLGSDGLVGGMGADILEGGLGAPDLFIYFSRAESTTASMDTIRGFETGSDLIDVSLAFARSVTFFLSGGFTIATVETIDGPLTIRIQGTAVQSDFLFTEDLFWGTDGNDALTGTARADVLFGGLGADKMTGLAGDDYYVVDNVGDEVIEAANSGRDTVDARISYTLGEHAEDLILGGTGAIDGTGNAVANLILGNDAANRIDGKAGDDEIFAGAGNDTITGGAGADLIVGGAGADRFVYGPGDIGGTAVVDHIADFETGVDILDLSALGRVKLGWSDVWDAEGGYFYTRLEVTAPAGKLVLRIDGYIARADVIADSGTYGTAGDDTIEGTADQDEIYGEAGNDRLFGGGESDALFGGAGNDLLDGGAGPDFLAGGAGDDVYVVDTLADWVEEAAGEGYDEIRSAIAVDTLLDFAHVEALTGTLSTGQSLQGNALANRLTGGGGNDVLDGAGGADRMAGGLGDDIYYVDEAGDEAVEEANAGTDEIRTSLGAYSLSANIEKLTGLSTAAQTLTGNALANVLAGGAGNDRIDGGVGADTLRGGAGNDIYVVDDAGDQVIELAGEGLDEVRASSASYSIAGAANVETLIGTSNAGQTLTGNGGDNLIVGGDGNDVIDAGAGTDTVLAGRGNDVLKDGVLGGAGTTQLDGGEGFDTADFSAMTSAVSIDNYSGALDGFNVGGTQMRVKNVERVIGTAHNDTLTLPNGTAGMQLYGGGGNDILQGNDTGIDALFGEAGNDTLVLQAGDSGDGGEGDDRFFLNGGPSAASHLVLNGGTGSDLLRLTFTGFTVDLAAGTGSVGLWTFSLTSFEQIEASVQGKAGAVVRGSDAAETFALGMMDDGSAGVLFDGRGGNDTLTGGKGNDTIIGGAGADLLAGGAGADRFVYLAASDSVSGAMDRITGFQTGADKIDLEALGRVRLTFTAANDAMTGVAYTLLGVTAGGQTMAIRVEGTVQRSDVLATTGIYGTAGDDILEGTAEADDMFGEAGNDTIFGRASADTIEGGAGNDVIDGGEGVDIMRGGTGDDSYVVDQAGDRVIENAGEGSDEVRTALAAYSLAGLAEVERLTGTSGAGQSLTGSARDNVIAGGAGNDVIDGGAGADRMAGGVGDDVYIVDHAGDTVVEDAGQGTDEVRTALAAWSIAATAVETLTGTSAGGQALTGNALANVIQGAAGDDVLDGGAGSDTMRGGQGNDVYVVDDADDIVVEAAGEGTDEIRTAFSSYSLNGRNNIENLTGISATGQVLTGNALDNVVTGGAGADTLDGGPGGNDTLRGGAGDDTYRADAGDLVVEAAGEGTDEVLTAAAAFSLAGMANVEKLTGTSPGAQALTGNEGSNIVTGGGANDVLDGGGGADILQGRGGDDLYLVDDPADLALEAANDGTDEVRSSAASFTLGDHLENLTGLLSTGQILAGNGLGNWIIGGGGDDFIYGGAGDDVFNAGAGNDYMDGGTGADAMGGFAGNDVYVVDEAADRVVEAENEGTDEIRTALASYSLEALIHVENLTGTSATGQTLIGNAANNVLFGGMGDDTLVAGAGNDILIGFGGSDVLRGQAGDDVYIIDAGDTVVELAGDGIDEVRTQAEIFVLTGAIENLRANSDIGHDFRGNELNNVIVGAAGNDVFRAQDGGGDLLFGLGGVDSFYMGGAFDNGDLIDGGDNRDSLILQGNYAGLTLTWNITGGSSIANIEGISLLSGSVTHFGQSGANLYSYNLTLVDGNIAAGALMKINGFNLQAGENFTLNASAETDAPLQVFAGFGIDNLTGGQQGDAFIFGHDGRLGAGDRVDGGGGYDVVYLRGDYTLDFNAAGFTNAFTNVESLAILTSANSEFAGGGDGDFDYTITWADGLLAAGATFTVNASRLQAHETFTFDGSKETDGVLRVFGGASADTLTGGGSSTQLHGGGGADVLNGGAGTDLFRYSNVGDSNAAATDTVHNFVAGTDKIDVGRVDAKASTSDLNEAFIFIGSNAFSAAGPNAPGQLRTYNVSGNLWRVEGDVNGDGVADLVIDVHVEASQPLTAGDFIV